MSKTAIFSSSLLFVLNNLIANAKYTEVAVPTSIAIKATPVDRQINKQINVLSSASSDQVNQKSSVDIDH